MSLTNITDPNDGRNRRKVIFRSDDMNFSDLDESTHSEDDEDDIVKTIDEVDPVSEDNGSDSEWSDSEEETKNKKDEVDKSRYYGQSYGKENEIRKKIANELAKLDKINKESKINIWNQDELDNSDNENIKYDEDSNDDDDDDDSDDEKDFKTDESDENDNLSGENDESFEGTKTNLAGKISSDSLQKTSEHTALNWKTNLAQKAAHAYYERQNSVANLWKLVYGSYYFIN